MSVQLSNSLFCISMQWWRSVRLLSCYDKLIPKLKRVGKKESLFVKKGAWLNVVWQDKWRNLSVVYGQGSRDKSQTPKAKLHPLDVLATSLFMTPVSVPVASSSHNASVDIVNNSIYSSTIAI